MPIDNIFGLLRALQYLYKYNNIEELATEIYEDSDKFLRSDSFEVLNTGDGTLIETIQSVELASSAYLFNDGATLNKQYVDKLAAIGFSVLAVIGLSEDKSGGQHNPPYKLKCDKFSILFEL